MGSSSESQRRNTVVDTIHGAIELTARERAIIDTPQFQRLRKLKQLQMGHLTYPNATHTRFAHSLGVLGAMQHVIRVAEKPLKLKKKDTELIRLAALLHDIGHYPYSHLVEGLDDVKLTEDFVAGPGTIDLVTRKYPNHENLGATVVKHQPQLVEAIGGIDRATEIANLFQGASKKRWLNRLMKSSLDVDRMDYLLRDSYAAGVPYGRIDLNYILNNLRVSKKGVIGVTDKALSAVEQYVFARFFMHKTVYFHKTTFGFEEACRQLLRRLRNMAKPQIPKDGNKVISIAKSKRLLDFTDAFVDQEIESATRSRDKVCRALARSISERRPPKLLKEVCTLEDRNTKHHRGTSFSQCCRNELSALAKSNGIPLGFFLFASTKPVAFEKRGHLMTGAEARGLKPEEKDELIKVFEGDDEEPKSIVDIEHSILHTCAGQVFCAHRLYVVCEDRDRVTKLRAAVSDWADAE